MKQYIKPFVCPFFLSLLVYLVFVVASSYFHGGTLTFRYTENGIMFSLLFGYGTLWIKNTMPDIRISNYVLGFVVYSAFMLLFLLPSLGIAYVYYNTLSIAPYYSSSRTITFALSFFLALFFGRAVIHNVCINEKLDMLVRFVVSVLLAVFLGFMLIVGFYPILHHSPLDANAIRLLLQIDLAESIEFLIEYCVIFLPAVFVAICFCLFYKGLGLYGTQERIDPIKALGANTLLLVLAVGSCFISKTNYLYEVKLSWEESVAKQKIADAHVPIEQWKLRSSELPIDGVYILVIGESHNRSHMSAYGYKRETSPFLELMMQEKPYNVVLFERSYSADNETNPALRMSLSAMNQYNDIPFAYAPTIVDAVKANNFDAYWISNHSQYPWVDTELGFISSQADFNAFTSHDLKTIKNPHDEAVLPYLDEIRNMRKGLIVVHLYGSHYRYESRYPKSFEIYKEHNRNDYYDNSVLYNDNIIKSIYEIFKDNPNFNALVYFADHGTAIDESIRYNLFDRSTVEIPMYILMSDRYLGLLESNTINALRSNAKKPITNDLIYNLMLSLMYIKQPSYYEPYNDPLSEQYDGDFTRFRTMSGHSGLNNPD